MLPVSRRHKCACCCCCCRVLCGEAREEREEEHVGCPLETCRSVRKAGSSYTRRPLLWRWQMAVCTPVDKETNFRSSDRTCDDFFGAPSCVLVSSGHVQTIADPSPAPNRTGVVRTIMYRPGTACSGVLGDCRSCCFPSTKRSEKTIRSS